MSALFRKIQKAEFTFPAWFSPEVKALLGKIMVCNPDERLTIEGIENDPWYSKGGVVELEDEPGSPVAASSASLASETASAGDHDIAAGSGAPAICSVGTASTDSDSGAVSLKDFAPGGMLTASLEKASDAPVFETVALEEHPTAPAAAAAPVAAPAPTASKVRGSSAGGGWGV